MSLETIMWLFTAAWVLALIERYVMYQRGWSGSYGEPVTLRQLLVGVPIAVACGTYFAIKAATSPDIALGGALVILLAFAVYQFIPWLRRGDRRYVPGLATELLLLYPLAIAAIWRAIAGGHLSAGGVLSDLVFLTVFLLVPRLVPKKPYMPPGPFGD